MAGRVNVFVYNLIFIIHTSGLPGAAINGFYDLNKLMLWLILTAIALATWLIQAILTKTVRLTLSPMLLPLILLAGVAAISTYINRDYSPDSFINRTAFYLAMPVWYLLFTSLISGSDQVRKALTACNSTS